MSALILPYPNFVNGVNSDAEQVDANNAAVKSFVDSEVVHVDGSKDFTGYPQLPAAAPTFPRHPARKQDMDALGASTAFTPAWTAATTNPVLGNGTLEGWWSRTGKRVSVDIKLTIGTTTTFGSGPWSFSLPVDAVRLDIGTWLVIPPGPKFGSCYTEVSKVTPCADTAFFSSTVPVAWSGTPFSHVLYLSIDYEVA